MQQRINNVRDSFSSHNLGAMFITNQYNITYLTGFSGLSPNEREGFLLITKKNAHLITFATYFHMFAASADGFVTHCITFKKRLHHILKDIILKEKIQTVGFESAAITVAELETLKKNVAVSWQETAHVVEALRKIKDANELAAIRRAAKVTDDVFEFIKGKIKKGVKEKDLALEIEFFIKSNAQDVAFSPIVAFDESATIPHYAPNNIKHITNNSLILLDFGAKIDNYCSDMTRIVFVGTPTNRQVNVYKTVLEAQKKVLSMIKPGIKASDVDALARDYIQKCGFTPYEHGLGHGVGLAIHESPKLRPDVEDVLQDGMVVTVEPGIYLPGETGVRIEDLVVLTKNGVEVLSKTTKEIIIL